MIVLGYIWLLKPSDMRMSELPSMIIVVCVTRFMALLDVRADEWDLRTEYKFNQTALTFLPFAVLFVAENKINRKFNF